MKQLRYILLMLILLMNPCTSYVFGQCAQTESSTSTPPPSFNTYQSGTTIVFCYTMTDFLQLSSNWIDGFEINFGGGWDATSLTPITAPNSCDGQGSWNFQTSSTSSANGTTFGPGFYYDRYFDPDNLGGNDYGDYTSTGTCAWSLCFSLTVNPTCSNPDLSVTVTAMGDGTCGSWNFASCPGIPFSLSTATCVPNCNGLNISITPTDPGCLNNNGSADAIVTGGTAPYTYAWNIAGTTSNQSGLSAGTYYATVTDINGCADTSSVVLQMPLPYALNTNVTNATCLGYCDGSITVSPLGGTPNYSYLWTPFAITQNLANVCAGNYSVTVTDINSCTSSASFTVTEPPGVSVNVVSTPTTCNGGCDGTLNAQASQGTPPYSYNWASGNALALEQNLCAGNFSVTITDANQCTLLGNGVVSQPPAIIVNLQEQPVSCFGFLDGSLVLSQQNATLPYTSLWSTGLSNNDSLNGVAAGNYSVTITDVNGCTGSKIDTVHQPEILTAQLIGQNTSCPTATDGTINTIASGGTPQYFYLWVNPAGAITPLISNLSPGNYSLIVSDANGCTVSGSDTIGSNPQFTIDAGSDTCVVHGESILLGSTVSQSGNFYYSWLPDVEMNSGSTPNPYLSPSQTATYTLIVSEIGSGCSDTDDVVICVNPTTYFYVPNAFTPNDDSYNDFFSVFIGEAVTINQCRLYNRWGQLVYDSPDAEWDGLDLKKRICAMGVYVYRITYSIEGDATEYIKEGNVTLIR